MTSDSTLADLLPLFRRCDNYTDRLNFWQDHGLTETLSYTTLEFDNDVNAGRASIAFLLWLSVECRTWEDLKQRPILTLTPFAEDDAKQFIDWALQVRPGMADAPLSVEGEIHEFKREYIKKERQKDRELYFEQERVRVDSWVDDIWESDQLRLDILSARELDERLYSQTAFKLRKGEDIDLSVHINLGQINMDWKSIDTYLFVKAQYNFSLFLEKFDPTDPTSTTPPPASDGSIKLTHHQIAIMHHIIGYPINDNNSNNIARKYYQTSGKKLKDTYDQLTSELTRTAKGKNTVKNYLAILPLLDGKHKEQAEKELRAAKKNNEKY